MVLIVRPFCDGARPGKAMPGPIAATGFDAAEDERLASHQLPAAPHGAFKTAGAVVAAGPKIRTVNGTKIKQGLRISNTALQLVKPRAWLRTIAISCWNTTVYALEPIPDSGVSSRMSRPLDIKLSCLRLCVLPVAEPHS
jgi:hypothetical protein